MRPLGGSGGSPTGGGHDPDLGADRPLASVAERPHLHDVGAPLGQREHRGGVDGAGHLVVSSPLLPQKHLEGEAQGDRSESSTSLPTESLMGPNL